MDTLKGIGWMVLAMLGFALADTVIKLSLGSVPPGQVIVAFSGGGALVFGVWARARGEHLMPPGLFSRAFVIRQFSEILGTVCFVIGLSRLDLSLQSAIIQVNPLLVALGAALFLGASVGWRRWTAILVGLAGVLIIVRPGMAGFDAASLWAVGAAVGLSGRDLATRAIPDSVSTLLLAAWGFGAATLAGVGLLALDRTWVAVDGGQSVLLFGALISILVAYYSVTAAMRVGDVASVTPFRYTRLIFALILAYLVFDEVPDGWTLFGAGLVIVAGLYTLLRERRLAP